MNEYQVEPITINTDALIPPEPSENPWDNRKNAYFMHDATGTPICSIVVTGYNRIHKTKYCVECILKYTQDINYELILVDNGSQDGTLEYFQAVPYKNKQIIHITKNCGIALPLQYYAHIFKGRYLVTVSNDVYVTKNWLSNLLKCYQSDPKIGFVEPVSSNVSNLQEIKLNFSGFEEMQQRAAKYNKSNPALWEERMRLISIISIFSRDVLDNVGVFDAGYLHDFAEDDLCTRIRRMGYKLILCRDTWICHDHDYRNLEDKNADAFHASLESGRAVYKEKYYGIDPWDDINNFELTLLTPLDTMQIIDKNIAALSVDVRCGTPVLEIKNRLKRRGISNVISYAFTTQAKYYLDLHTLCDEVQCDRIDFIQDYYSNGDFNIVMIGEPINTYAFPIRILQKLYGFLKPGGLLLFKIRNTDNFKSFLRTIGMEISTDPDLPSSTPYHEVIECLKLFGAKDCTISAEIENLSENDKAFLMEKLKAVNPNANTETLQELCIKNYCLEAVKG